MYRVYFWSPEIEDQWTAKMGPMWQLTDGLSPDEGYTIELDDASVISFIRTVNDQGWTVAFKSARIAKCTEVWIARNLFRQT
jgi:hypothetical protein